MTMLISLLAKVVQSRFTLAITANSPNRQTVPETSETDILVDPRSSTAERLAGLTVGIELADHDIGRMRHDCAENTSHVTTNESHTSLSTLGVVVLLAWEVVVDSFDDGFERGELHHGIRNLATPERCNAFVETSDTLTADDFADAVECAVCEWWKCGLHTNLDSFERTETDVGKEFSGGGTSEVDIGLVLDGVLLADLIRVELLEELVAAVFESALD